MKKPIMILAIILLTITIVSLSGCIQKDGTLILKITDAPPEINMTHSNVTISYIEVHKSAGPGNETNKSIKGWLKIIDEPITIDLLTLQDVTQILGEINLQPGIYTQIRLYIEKANITVDGVIHELTINSNSIKLVKAFIIRPEQTTTLTLDFDIHKSVKKTGSDDYTMTPTIKIIQE